KAGAVTPCDQIEGPLVVLDTGDFVEISDAATARRVAGHGRVIAYLGEILVPCGEFLQNNHVLMPGAFGLEWYGALLRERLRRLPENWETVDAPQAIAWSREFGLPLHPRYNLFFHDLTVEELKRLRDLTAAHGRIDDGRLILPGDEEPRELLVHLGVPYHVAGQEIVVERHTEILLATLGIESEGPSLTMRPAPEATDPLVFVSQLAGFPVKARGPTRIGARMARPEKSAPRKMQPAPHSLFPIGHEGGPQRLLVEAGAARERHLAGEARHLRLQRRHHPVRHDEPPSDTLHAKGGGHLRRGSASARLHEGPDRTAAGAGRPDPRTPSPRHRGREVR